MNNTNVAILVNGIMDCWKEDTFCLSYTDTNHPAFTLVKKIADKEWYRDTVIITILKRMEEEFTFFASILFDIIPEKDWPKISDDMRGKIEKIREIWVKWGKEKGYLNE